MNRPHMRADYRTVVDGLTFRVRESGSSGGLDSRPYVLVHGIGASHRYFQRLHDEIATRAQVYSIDIPGFAGLPRPDSAPSVSEIATALGVLLDRLHVHEAVLVGHSMGAQWAVETGALRPDLIGAVVAIGPVTDERHRSLVAQGAALALDILTETPTVNAVVMLDYLRCGPAWFLRETRPMLTYPIEQRVPLLEMPLLIVRGGRDPIAGMRWCRQLRDAARSGRFVVIPGHRHVVQFTAPRAVASAIRAFVATDVSLYR